VALVLTVPRREFRRGTLFQTPAMNNQQFDYAMKEMDAEMNKLREILER
jgi:hypothetical protein